MEKKKVFFLSVCLFVVYSFDKIRFFLIMFSSAVFSSVFNLVLSVSNCGASCTSSVYIINLICMFAQYCLIIHNRNWKMLENCSFLIPVNDCLLFHCYAKVCNDFCQKNLRHRLNLINEYHYLLIAWRIYLLSKYFFQKGHF